MFDESAVGQSADSADHPMSFLLTEEFELDLPQAGEIRHGQIVSSRKNEVLIDIGAKSEGIIPGSELETMDKETKAMLSVGASIPVFVVNPEDRNGNTILSYNRAMEEEDWTQAQELLDNQEVYHGSVIGFNRGGLLVRLGRIRGFVPASQLSSERRSGLDRNAGEERFTGMVGDDITTKVIEVDRSRNRLILSERAATKEIRATRREQLLKELAVGDTRDGRIVNLADFGAFVDIGGLEGLVHLSELSWKRVNHPGDILKVGDKVQVYVLNIDRDRNRVALSLKRLEPDPWTTIDNTYAEGALVEATITKLTNYGAFARFNDEFALEGLIHVSELSNERVNHPRDIVEPEQVVTARIIRIDPERRQMGLSLKQVASAKYMEADLAMANEADSDLAMANDADADLAMASDADAELVMASDVDAELAMASDADSE